MVNALGKQTDEVLPESWLDHPFPEVPRKAEITAKNKLTVDKALYHIRTERKNSLG